MNELAALRTPDGDNEAKDEEACTADQDTCTDPCLLHLHDDWSLFSSSSRESLQRTEQPHYQSHGEKSKREVHDYLDRVLGSVTQFGTLPKPVFRKTTGYAVKRLVRKHKASCQYCAIRAHSGTGKASLLVMTISLCIMHYQTYPHSRTLMPLLDTMFEEWCEAIDEQKPSACKETNIKKRERYIKVLQHNRRM